MASGQRQDIQGLRAVAILSVLLFHFFPECFPNGYLGVDMFFVISGYLISKILSKSTSFAPSAVLSFYYRRAKRIVPLYLVYMSVAVLLYIYHAESDNILDNQASATAAFGFYTNIHSIVQKDDYFKGVGKDLFTHTWSLSVEMQFYLLVPLLFLIASNLPGGSRVYLVAIGVLSLVLFVVLPTTMQFNLMLARLWQFFAVFFVGSVEPKEKKITGTAKIGDAEDSCCLLLNAGVAEKDETLIHCEIHEEETDEEQKSFSQLRRVRYVLSLLLLIVPLIPFELSTVCLRILTVLSTAVIIVDGDGNESAFLSCKIMEFLGDISYSIYLFHWPFAIFVLPTTSLLSPVRFSLIPVSVFISTVTYFAFERHYRCWRVVTVLSFSALFGTTCGLLIYFSPTLNQYIENARNARLEAIRANAIKVNEHVFSLLDELMMIKECKYSIYHNDTRYKVNPPFGVCEMPNGDGKLKFAVIGNSYADNQADLIYKYFKPYFSTFKMYSEPACEPLAYTHHPFCPHLANFTEIMEEWKPDVTFLFQRHYAIKETPVTAPGERDEPAEEVIGNMRKLLPLSSYFFILDSFPSFEMPVHQKMNEFIRANMSADRINDLIIHREQMVPGRVRTQKLKRSCEVGHTMIPKCELFDIVSVLLDSKGRFAVMDDQNFFALFDVQMHLSPYGRSRVETLYPNFVRRSTLLLEELTRKLETVA